MVDCSKCREHVNSVLLRSDNPKCENGHSLGEWYHCGNPEEKHVYLTAGEAKCPYCGNAVRQKMSEGVMVKCLHVTDTNSTCTTRSFAWIREGPPCFMNHVDKMRVVA